MRAPICRAVNGREVVIEHHQSSPATSRAASIPNRVASTENRALVDAPGGVLTAPVLPGEVIPEGAMPLAPPVLPGEAIPEGAMPLAAPVLPGEAIPEGAMPLTPPVVPGEAIPEAVIPEGDIAEGAIPEGVIPEGDIPEVAIPAGTLPERGMPEGAIGEGESLEEAIPAGALLEVGITEGEMAEGRASRSSGLVGTHWPRISRRSEPSGASQAYAIVAPTARNNTQRGAALAMRVYLFTDGL